MHATHDPMTATLPRKPLSDRAKARLKIAAQLMRHEPQMFGLAKSWKLDDTHGFFEGVEVATTSLNADHRRHLKSLVDWVEEYDSSRPA
jgi:hypothetical protein